MKRSLGPSDAFFPVPAALIVSGIEKPNIITIAWIGIASSSPPTIAVSLKKSRYSLSLIRETQEFSVNIPQDKDYQKVDFCGIVSGKKTDKFKATGFTPIPSKKIATPIIEECPYNMVCFIYRPEYYEGDNVKSEHRGILDRTLF